jgi:hypothetical protein
MRNSSVLLQCPPEVFDLPIDYRRVFGLGLVGRVDLRIIFGWEAPHIAHPLDDLHGECADHDLRRLILLGQILDFVREGLDGESHRSIVILLRDDARDQRRKKGPDVPGADLEAASERSENCAAREGWEKVRLPAVLDAASARA